MIYVSTEPLSRLFDAVAVPLSRLLQWTFVQALPWVVGVVIVITFWEIAASHFFPRRK